MPKEAHTHSFSVIFLKLSTLAFEPRRLIGWSVRLRSCMMWPDRIDFRWALFSIQQNGQDPSGDRECLIAVLTRDEGFPEPL
jgi:hypothetical protein